MINHKSLAMVNPCEFLFSGIPDEILLRILTFLDALSLRDCFLVCRRWQALAKVALVRHQRIICVRFTTACYINRLGHHFFRINDFISVTSKSLVERMVLNDTFAVISFIHQSTSHGRSVFHKPLKAADIYSSVNSDFSNIPRPSNRVRSLHFLGGYSDSTFRQDFGFSTILFPRTGNYSIKQVLIPLDYSVNSRPSLKSHLTPSKHNQTENAVFFFMVNAVPTGRLSNIVVALRKAYGNEICIVGCSSEQSITVDSTTHTDNVVAGWLLVGNINCECHIFSNDSLSGSKTGLEQTLAKFFYGESPGEKCKHRVAIMITTGQTGRDFPREEVTAMYPSKMIWSTHTAVYGCEFNSSTAFNPPGGRDYLQTDSTVMLLLAIS